MKQLILVILILLCATQVLASEIETYDLELSKDSRLVIKMKRFNKQDHQIEYYGDGESKYPLKIDGNTFYMNDFSMPYWEVVDLRVKFRDTEYILDHSCLYDLWHPLNKIKEHLLLTCSESNCTLEGLFGDGAGTFMASWRFGSGKSERIELGADESKMLPLINRLNSLK